MTAPAPPCPAAGPPRPRGEGGAAGRCAVRLAVLVAAIVGGAATAGAQAAGAQAAGAQTAGAQGRLPARVTASAVYQQVLDDPALGDSSSLRQVAVPLVVLAPVAPGVDVSVRASYASSSRDGGEAASGFADAQVGLTVRRSVGGAELVVGLAGTVPAGGGLTRAEAATAFLAAQDFYAFAAPTLRRGPSVSPSLSVAVPAGPALVVGGGVAYRLRPAFEPVAGLPDALDPGDEVTLTVGLDALLSDGSALAVDGLYVRYGTDTVGELAYTTGDAVGASAEWSGLVGRTTVAVAAAALQRVGTDVDRAVQARLGRDTVVPTQVRIAATARVRLGPMLVADVSAGGRYYAASAAAGESGTFERSGAFGSRSLLDVRVLPAFQVADGVAVVGRLGGTVGSFTAVEAGLGLSVSL